VDIVSAIQIAESVAAVQEPLEALSASFRRGQILRNGAAIALIGPPNAGKSSLFNRLLERERAIVTSVPGTTRDTVEESLALAGIPLRLIDTAGLRSYTDSSNLGIDAAEQQGIARSLEALADADLVLVVHDATLPLSAAEREWVNSLAGRAHLLIQNKIDLVSNGKIAEKGSAISTSALTGAGLDQLREEILAQLGAAGPLADTASLNNLRQQETIGTALAALSSAAAANESSLPHELILMDLHRALRALDSLTGATTPDDILARIFSTFCIGK
jgi:tRNA modification GTPase